MNNTEDFRWFTTIIGGCIGVHRNNYMIQTDASTNRFFLQIFSTDQVFELREVN